ncbi:MAG: VOC family protein [Actinomycetota bacterium]|nr:VOC family protein [Actinomycetota bacterium]
MEEKIFNHVALIINDLSEIKDFYADILGLETIRKFTLPDKISGRVFGIEKETEITLVGRKDLAIELFESEEGGSRDYQHVCIAVGNREQVIQKARENNYPTIIIKRDTSDLVFIKDKSGNLFEVKQF